MKPVLIVISLFVYSFSRLSDFKKTQTANELQRLPDSIKWSPAFKLSFTDFNELSIGGRYLKYDSSKYKLAAYSSIVIGYSMRQVKERTTFDAFAFFLRNKSWIRERNAEILNHEQGHFDIAEIYALRLKKKMQSVQNMSGASYWQFFQQSYLENEILHKKEQDNYDAVSVTRMGQKYYINKIQNDLKEFE